MCSCGYSKISHNVFFKEPFGQLLLHKYSFCLLSYHDLMPKQKRCDTYFLAKFFFSVYFVGLEQKLAQYFTPLA